ncbi:tetratricopeptide repeat protein [Streptomyces sp. NPDC005799]|uniref:tetratricopeptide repeat protein n=1 Tax=Streptomyces sp. NPDC005799 TaxID=3154678 RepID=UPI00340208B2
MSRLSREKKREQKGAALSAALVAAPIDVHVPAGGPGAGGASIGGVPVVPAAGEEIQQAVLDHLHRIVLATGHPVRATIHDERIGCVVHLQVAADGSSTFTGEPVRMPPAVEPVEQGKPVEQGERAKGEARHREEAVPSASAVRESAPATAGVALSGDAVAKEHPAQPSDPQPQSTPYRDKPTHLLRPTSESVRDAVPTFPLRALPEPPQDRAPGTVAPPTGQFGPPPPMDAIPPHAVAGADQAPGADRTTGARADHSPHPLAASLSAASAPHPLPAPPSAASAPSPLPAPDFAAAAPNPLAIPPLDPGPEPTPTPARGFDAVAEAVLGDEPSTTTGVLAEPMTRINEAVKAGRIAEADGLAVGAVGEAMAVLGPEHGEVLKLRELTAYIAYLAGDPVRAFRLSLDLARTYRRAGDAEGAYGNVQSAASAWRAVRDPHQGLELGRDLIGLWTELTAEEGPAADDIEELESARARMGRLTERARKSSR